MDFATALATLGDWEYREEQEKIFNSIIDLFSSTDDVLLEAPTGWGKSLIAMTTSLNFGDSFILTAEKVLQDQYANDFPKNLVHVIKGKDNYMCFYNPERTAANAPCVFVKGFNCPSLKQCPYRNAWRLVDTFPVVICNYHVILQNRLLADRPDPRSLAIFDECHAIEKTLYDQFALTIDLSLQDALVRLAEMVETYSVPVPAEFKTCVNKVIAKDWVETSDFVIDFYEEFVPLFEDVQSYVELNFSENDPATLRIGKVLSFIRRYCDIFEMFNQMADEIEAFLFEKQEGALKVVPSDIAPFINVLKNIGAKRIWMSATIGDVRTFAKMMGIRDYKALKLPSIFPVKNRQIYVCNKFNVNYRFVNDRASVNQLCEAIEVIVEKHKGENGIIHAGTYKLSNIISKFLSDRGYTVWSHKDSKNRHGVLKLFRQHGGILVSPSLYQGINLEDDVSRWQIIVKIPFDSLSSNLVKYKKESQPGWYQYQAALKVMQAYGRSIRHKEDWAVTYILDSNFRIIKRFLSDWVLEALNEDCPFD